MGFHFLANSTLCNKLITFGAAFVVQFTETSPSGILPRFCQVLLKIEERPDLL